MQDLTSLQMVKSLVDAYSAQNASLRQKHVYEQTLLALVRLAKSEQFMEIKANVRKLTGPLPILKPRVPAQRTKLEVLAQLALPGLEEKEKVGAHGTPVRRRK
ncbi:hypothetical protein [Janthinobacterium sp. 17J80-10]|uniref:hypothetical protein n=1 Tax=Janthinobacterium sp. 17J80-10 TaxID=2497863 RepID=UPI0010053EED|nr:hypothetical protein [Janthinobacterium sp. 17J80-10]QAU34994.1 hypothetical protein EKL02_12835 [Janthinobacterium sp. 17J80-10]